MPTNFKVLKAEHGDSILIKTYNLNGDSFVILVDGGTSKTFKNDLKKELQSIQVIDLLVLTHIDADHIAGIIKFVESDIFKEIEIKRYWVNSKNIPFLYKGNQVSYGQVVTLEMLLIDINEPESKWSDRITKGMTMELDEGITAEIISPTDEILETLYTKWPDLPNEYYAQYNDIPITGISSSQVEKGSLKELAETSFKPDNSVISDIFNSSSIAFVLKATDMSLLLLGDARPEIYIEGLKCHGYSVNNKLKVDFVKVSHHGSMNNTTTELADIVECENYIFSTNGGLTGHRLPDRETLARIIYNPERINKGFEIKRTVYFNYSLNVIEEKAGKLVDEKDFEDGNWQISDDTTCFN